MELQGRIVQILPLQSGVGKASGKEWKKQEFIIEIPDGQYSRKVCFNLWGDLIDRTALQVGEEVTVQIDLESREFNGRWYTDVKGWRVDRGLVSLSNVGMGAAPAAGMPAAQPAPQQIGQPLPNNGPFGGVQPPTVSTPPQPIAADDLPF